MEKSSILSRKSVMYIFVCDMLICQITQRLYLQNYFVTEAILSNDNYPLLGLRNPLRVSSNFVPNQLWIRIINIKEFDGSYG